MSKSGIFYLLELEITNQIQEDKKISNEDSDDEHLDGQITLKL